MSNSYLSTLICRQAKKYGDRVALKYRNYETESWVPVSWNQFAAKVKSVSNSLIALGAGVQENIGIFSQNMPKSVYRFWRFRKQGGYYPAVCHKLGGTSTLYIGRCGDTFLVCGRAVSV